MEQISLASEDPREYLLAGHFQASGIGSGVGLTFLSSEGDGPRLVRMFVPYEEAVKLSAQLRRAIAGNADARAVP
jgi:hypothetical protein